MFERERRKERANRVAKYILAAVDVPGQPAQVFVWGTLVNHSVVTMSAEADLLKIFNNMTLLATDVV